MMADVSEPVAQAYLDALALCEDRDARNLARLVGGQGSFIHAAADMSRMAFLSASCMYGAETYCGPPSKIFVLGRYWPSSIATKTTPDPTANKPHKSLMMLLTGMTKPRPTASVVAHIKPLTTEDIFRASSSPPHFWLADHPAPSLVK